MALFKDFILVFYILNILRTTLKFPSLNHDQEVVIWIEVTELVMALEGDPHVGAEVELAVTLEIFWHRDIIQKLGEGLLHGGHGQVAGSCPGVPLDQVLAIFTKSVSPDGVGLAHPVILLVSLPPHPHLVVPDPVHQVWDGPAPSGSILCGISDNDGSRLEEIFIVELLL